MKCMICNTQLNSSSYCPGCGCNVTVQRQIVALSNLYYNRGLEKAQIRDLSGAITCLQRSLRMYKYNIQARNLLGLVYFETGEVVAALSEWVISKNMQPEGNIAADYINRLQKNANRLDTINMSIKKYNQCLEYCKRGSIDMAEMQLRKVLADNPKLIKGYHLLALIYIRAGKYEKARKQLKIAAKIDKTNTTTLRFLREVEEQTGRITNLEPRFKAKEKVKQQKDGRVIYRSGNDTVIQPMEYRERTVTNTLINLIIGLLVGASALWFLVVPAQTQRINQKANQKVVEYSDKVATQAAELTRLQSEIDSSSESVNTATDQISEANEKATSYENLLKAWQAYNDENYETAANALEDVNSDLLSVEAKSMYDAIMGDIGYSIKQKYQSDAMDAYESGDYATAIDNYTKALNIGEPDFTSMFYLAQSYQKSGDTENAKTWYQKIIDTFPGTQNATDAQDYLDALTGGSSSTSGSSQTSQTQSQSDEEEDNSDSNSDEEDTSDYSNYDEEEDTSDYSNYDEEGDTSNYDNSDEEDNTDSYDTEEDSEE